MTRACRNCQWWLFREHDGRGECRGAPPATSGGFTMTWPVTRNDDWCGAFRMAERLAGGISNADFEDAHARMAERLAGMGKGTEQ